MNTAPSGVAPAIPGPGNKSDPVGIDGSSANAKKILVIDDNIVFLKAMSMKLRALGYDVLTAVDGAAAVSTVRRIKPDLILLDLNFPPDVAHGGGVDCLVFGV